MIHHNSRHGFLTVGYPQRKQLAHDRLSAGAYPQRPFQGLQVEE